MFTTFHVVPTKLRPYRLAKRFGETGCALPVWLLGKPRMSRPRLIALFLVLVTLAAYYPAVSDGFSLFDDKDYVTNNRIVQQGLTWAGIKWAFTTWHAGNWHPLTWISHMIDCDLFGPNARGHHCVNLLFHAANAALVFALLLRLTEAVWPGAFAAALFAWHPLHVESVAWISERKDLLSTFFALLALLAYTRYARDRPPGESRGAKAAAIRPRRSSAVNYSRVGLFFVLSLLAKPMFVTLPFVMLLLDYWPLRRLPGPKTVAGGALPWLVLEKWLFFALSAATCALTLFAQHSGGLVLSLAAVPLGVRLENVPLAYVRYLLKMIWPANLAAFYPMPAEISPLLIIAAVGILILISAAVWLQRKQSPYWLVGWLWFLGTLTPVIGLVSIGGVSMADRYSYFPSVGIFFAVALGVRDGAARLRFSTRTLMAAAGVSLVVCLALLENQLRYWRDNVSLFSHVLEVSKNTRWVRYRYLGWLHLRLGYALETAGRKTEVVAECHRAVELEPNDAGTRKDAADLLAEAGHADEALVEYQQALRLNPVLPSLHYSLGVLFVTTGQIDEALKQCAAAAQLDPNDWRPPYMTGVALLRRGGGLAAVPYFRQALRLEPDSVVALVYLSRVLASDENPAVRDGREALTLAQKAIALSDAADPTPLDVLSMAFAELGRFDEAQATEQDVLNLVTAQNLTNQVPVIRRRLQLYENHQPFRQAIIKALPEEALENNSGGLKGQ